MENMLVEQKTVMDVIYATIANINSLDEIEAKHIRETLAWIKSGSPIYRIAKPDLPKKHLVAYFVLFDEVAAKILLVDHKNAKLWLPTGGHVEVDEDPKNTVRRECVEELGFAANFLYEYPVFLTITNTVGLTAGHTDVSLWYVLKGDCQQDYSFDKAEFSAIKWFALDEVPYDKTDPHMRRFIAKL
jgi:8-oxo-dGTP pyrophosphatase MutT (NUDIX family)